MWSRVQTDTQQSPLHVQHTQSTAALASFSTQTHVVVHLRCLSYLWHVQSGCFYCFNQSAAIKQPAKPREPHAIFMMNAAALPYNIAFQLLSDVPRNRWSLSWHFSDVWFLIRLQTMKCECVCNIFCSCRW